MTNEELRAAALEYVAADLSYKIVTQAVTDAKRELESASNRRNEAHYKLSTLVNQMEEPKEEKAIFIKDDQIVTIWQGNVKILKVIR